MLYGVETQGTITPKPAGSAYTAQAVHFAGSLQSTGPTYLSRSSLSCTDNGLFSFSFWTKGLTTHPGNDTATYASSDPVNLECFFASVPSGGGQLEVFFENATFTNNFLLNVTAPSSTSWHHILCSASTSTHFSTPLLAVYIDDVKTGGSGTYTGAFVPTMNGVPFFFGDDSFNQGPTCDFADVWIAPGVGLLQSDGTIQTSDRRKFINADLTPVNPITFPSSAILFTGGASTFHTNQGTGGAFTVTGTITNASTHP